MRCSFHVCGSSVILLAVAFSLTAETIINVGSIDVLPDLDGQVIEIVAEMTAGGIADAVTGLNLRIRIGDGMGSIVEPTFSMTAGNGRGVDFTGGIWDDMPSTTIGSVVAEAPQFLQASIVFNAEATSVPAIG